MMMRALHPEFVKGACNNHNQLIAHYLFRDTANAFLIIFFLSTTPSSPLFRRGVGGEASLVLCDAVLCAELGALDAEELGLCHLLAQQGARTEANIHCLDVT